MKNKWIFGSAIALCVLSILASICLGSSQLTLSELWGALVQGPADYPGWVFWYLRLPRTAACLLSGAALSVCGVVIQSVLGNPLASPGILGVNAGAGAAVTLCTAFGMLGGWAVAGAAFLGALVAVVLVMLIARAAGAGRSTIILGGVAVGSVLGAVSESVTTLVPDAVALSMDFRIVGFSSVAHTRLVPAAALIAGSLVIVFLMKNELDVLSLGEETARGLGQNVRRMRLIFLVLAALLAGASVSISGLLGFVGLIVPNACRRLVGASSGKLLPLSALAGAGFVTACDLAARTLFLPYEIPVGILLSLIGGSVFVWLLLRTERGTGS